jgi:hypothetical protein
MNLTEFTEMLKNLEERVKFIELEQKIINKIDFDNINNLIQWGVINSLFQRKFIDSFEIPPQIGILNNAVLKFDLNDKDFSVMENRIAEVWLKFHNDLFVFGTNGITKYKKFLMTYGKLLEKRDI